jgi:hypothetical protein
MPLVESEALDSRVGVRVHHRLVQSHQKRLVDSVPNIVTGGNLSLEEKKA